MDLNGVWYNELNSVMFLEVKVKRVRGFYISAVGDATGPYELTGFIDVGDETPTVGWVVAWQNDAKQARSVTTWCGQAQEIDTVPQIDATWLLVRSTAVAEDWESTMVSKDLFKRARTQQSQVDVARRLRGVKHLRIVSEEEVKRAIEEFRRK